jgi:hypothetical protein
VKRTHVEAMSSLSQANPLEHALDRWTRSEEDALLAGVFTAESEESPREADTSVPLAPPHRLKRAALIGLCVVAMGAAVLAVDLVGSGSPSAFAAWTTATTTPPPSQLGAAQSACQSFYKRTTKIFKQIPTSIPGSLPPLAVIDARGPYEMIVYAGTSGEGVCLWHSSGVIGAGASAGNGGSLPATSDHSIGIPGVGFMRIGGRSVLTYAYGHAGPSVTGVTLHLTNGVRVQATVHDGFYAAWWPSQTDVTAATVSTSEGVHHQNFCDIGPNNYGPNEPITSCTDP